MEKKFYKNFDKSRIVSLGTVGAINTSYWNYGTHGNSRNYGKWKKLLQNFDESRQISIWTIEAIGTMGTIGTIRSMGAIGTMVTLGTLRTMGTMENGEKLL